MTTTTDYDIIAEAASPEYDVTTSSINFTFTSSNFTIGEEQTVTVASNISTNSYVTSTNSYVTLTNASVTSATWYNITRITNRTLTSDDVMVDETYQTVMLAGSIAAIVVHFCIIGLLFGMGMKGIRSHIHCNVCFSMLTSHVLLVVGAQRTPATFECKMVSMTTQYFILVGLTWLILEGVHLFRLSMVGSDLSPKITRKQLRRQRKERLRNQRVYNNYVMRTRMQQKQLGSGEKSAGSRDEGELKTTANGNSYLIMRSKPTRATNTHTHDDEKDGAASKSKCFTRLKSFYIIGWIGPLLFVAATVPTVLEQQRGYSNCWLVTSNNDVLWIFGAPIPAVFMFHCVVMILTVFNYKRKINQGKSLGNESTKSINSEDEAPSQPTVPRHHRRDEAEVGASNTSPGNEGGRISPDVCEEDSDSGDHMYTYRQLRGRYDGDRGEVRIHPPIFEIRHRTFAVKLPDNEMNEPVSNYVTAVHWHFLLVPLVCITWASGIVSVNYHWVAFNYTFCVLNICQSLFIFAFYCVMTFRLRHRWHVMTSREVNFDARPVTVWLGNVPDDDCDAINGKRMGQTRKRKKIPNIDLMTRTPTPFKDSKRIVREESSSDSDSNRRNIRVEPEVSSLKPHRRNFCVKTESLLENGNDVIRSLDSGKHKMTSRSYDGIKKATKGRRNTISMGEVDMISYAPPPREEDPQTNNIKVNSPVPTSDSNVVQVAQDGVHPEQQEVSKQIELPGMANHSKSLDSIRNPRTNNSMLDEIAEILNEGEGRELTEEAELSLPTLPLIKSVEGDILIGNRDKDVAKDIRPKPLLKSKSQLSFLSYSHATLRSSNSFPSTQERRNSKKSLNLDEILSNEPFISRITTQSWNEPPDSAVPSSDTTPSKSSQVSTPSQDSQNPLIRTTPPQLIELPITPQPDPRKTYTISHPRTTDYHDVVLPTPRVETHSFSPVSKIMKQEASIPIMSSRSSSFDKFKRLFKK